MIFNYNISLANPLTASNNAILALPALRDYIINQGSSFIEYDSHKHITQTNAYLYMIRDISPIYEHIMALMIMK